MSELSLSEVGEMALKVALLHLHGIDWDNRPPEQRNWQMRHMESVEGKCHSWVEQLPPDALWFWGLA